LDVYSEYLRSFVMMIQVKKREVCTKSYFPLPGRHFSAYFDLPEKLARARMGFHQNNLSSHSRRRSKVRTIFLLEL
jgi:hypothetical protein